MPINTTPVNNEEEKVNKFYTAINHYALEQRKKIEHEIAEFKSKKLEEAENEVLAEAYHLIQKEMAQMRGGISREMAKREIDCRRGLLEQRQKITDEVFKQAAESLLQYTQTDRYPALLQKLAKEIALFMQKKECDALIIYLKPGDEKYRDSIVPLFSAPCSFVSDPEIQLGGLRVSCEARRLVADSTLDALLKDQLPWFEEHSHLAIS
ncbi:V-type ATP synthase subunit E [uncultured Ruminococcus sp.]|uniref:ATPase n=1 Tax=Hydrogeniiclostridium mannosilyticum TaxID=2764322 RepID=A0A328UHF2_9FIRM|nr:V-type ATP synthase subunit E family protein [Hydrogeniiclostridium mannosilyticum]RAQ30202.1 hypothetical protein DPQ25_01450 [Hydrogeniiclostridium mannosilyticum]SCH08731.1 V-type ATP synthase subunit E [uncultured Ruminococcus sp.]